MLAYRVTLVPGDGIGPEISAAATTVLAATGVGIDWEVMEAGEKVLAQEGTPLPPAVVESVQRNGVALKGPLTTPVGRGFRSVNVALRQELNLFANLRPARNRPGVPSRFQDVDLVVVRENTEDLYAGVEHRVGRTAAESIKIITREASERIARFAFDFARRTGRKKVTCVHKANIMKLSDGLFLTCAQEVAAGYEDIEFGDMIVDAMCMKLVQSPADYDVLLCPNLYGDILSDLCAGLVGGLGVTPSANLGEGCAVFEPVHGSAPRRAGQNVVNPLAMILSGAMLLAHLGETLAAARLEAAVDAVLAEGTHLTYDLGGRAGTDEMAAAIVDRLGG